MQATVTAAAIAIVRRMTSRLAAVNRSFQVSRLSVSSTVPLKSSSR